jgi:hypothetical protein
VTILDVRLSYTSSRCCTPRLYLLPRFDYFRPPEAYPGGGRPAARPEVTVSLVSNLQR